MKQEIYRLPDRLLYRLAMYYGILPESGWDAVDQLANQGIIGVGASAKQAAHHLQELALQLGDAALSRGIAAQQAAQPLLAQLLEQYPWAAEALHTRLASLLPETVDEHPQLALERRSTRSNSSSEFFKNFFQILRLLNRDTVAQIRLLTPLLTGGVGVVKTCF